MPIYQNSTPPYALSSGDVGFSFNNEAFPSANTAGSQFALPSYTGIADGGTALRWTLVYGTAPTSVSVRLEGAINDVDSEYSTLDTAAGTTTGESRALTGVQARFVRVKVVSSSGGSGFTAKFLV